MKWNMKDIREALKVADKLPEKDDEAEVEWALGVLAEAWRRQRLLLLIKPSS